MDSEKRALYLIKKDDVQNFKKYAYDQSFRLFWDATRCFGASSKPIEEKMLTSIYQNKSKKIFIELLNSSYDLVKSVQPSERLKCVRGNSEEFIKMCIFCNCFEGIEFLDLKHFVVTDKTSSSNKVPFHIRHDENPCSHEYSAFTISKDLFHELFASGDKQIIDYLCDVDFFKGGNTIGLMTDNVIEELYLRKDEKRLNDLIEKMNEYNQFAKGIYDESTHGSWYTGKRISNNAIYFINNAHGEATYLRAYVCPIISALSLALKNKDYKWVEVFNDYNSKLASLIPDLKLNIYSNKDIQLIKMKNDPKTSIVELLEMENLNDSFFELKKIINCACLDLDGCKERLNQIPDIDKNFISKYFITPLEMMLICLEKKNFKPLFKFATDIEYKELQDAVINGEPTKIKDMFSEMFMPSEYIFRNYDSMMNSLKNINVISGGEHNEELTEKARKEKGIEYQEIAKKNLIEEKHNLFRRKTNDKYFNYLEIQLANIPVSHIYDNLTLEDIQKIKTDYVKKCINHYEDLIEEYTHRKALEKEYEKITKELSKEYLVNEINRGKAVVLICKRLQIILQYKYKYEGDLFEMIDKYMNDRLKYHEMINPYDDEDNNYYNDLETDRLNTEDNNRIKRRRDLLHKLRMKRNNIVHAEMKTVDMSKEEILECIDLIELISK